MKLKEVIQKNYKFVFIFLLIVWCCNFCYPLNLDEIWNYGFANNLYRGLIPYKDFNMILTPFYPFLMSLPFHLFGSNEIIMILCNSLIVTYILYLLDKMIGDKFAIILLFMLVPYCTVMPSYNVFLYAILVILIYLEEQEHKNEYVLGFIIGLAVLTKQTVGVCLLLPSLYYIKDFKIILKRIIGFLIPIISFFIYLLITKSFNAFLDLCVFGLLDFTENGKGFNFLLILSLVMFAATLYITIKDRKSIKNYYVLAFFTVLIPLVDLSHFVYVFWAFLILILPKIKYKYIHYQMFSYITILVFSLFVFCDNIKGQEAIYPNKINHFSYRLINDNYLKMTNLVNNYIQKSKNKVVLFDGNGYYFRIINDEDCEYIDLLNTGNWGYNGSDKLLKEIQMHPNYIYLVDDNEFGDDAQTDKNALHYIVEHGTLVDHVGIYDVYTFSVIHN